MEKQLIYCVDDEESIRALYEEALPMGGYECLSFPDASSFWNALKRKQPDLIILDIMLPGMDGMALLKNIMESEFSSIPVIMVSAKGKETDKVKGLNEGASDYLSKPFGVMELLARIKANLRKCIKVDTIKYKELTLNKSQHEISLNEESLHLSLKEYDLLAYFLTHVNKAISKEELLTKVWGVECSIETRTIDMFVSRLRKKLNGSSISIETVRGLGYIMR